MWRPMADFLSSVFQEITLKGFAPSKGRKVCSAKITGQWQCVEMRNDIAFNLEMPLIKSRGM